MKGSNEKKRKWEIQKNLYLLLWCASKFNFFMQKYINKNFLHTYMHKYMQVCKNREENIKTEYTKEANERSKGIRYEK